MILKQMNVLLVAASADCRCQRLRKGAETEEKRGECVAVMAGRDRICLQSSCTGG
jgi:hypothetical protein